MLAMQAKIEFPQNWQENAAQEPVLPTQVCFVAPNPHILFCSVYFEDSVKCTSSQLHTLITKTESRGLEWYATTVYGHHFVIFLAQKDTGTE
jgi:hypothetical protein